MKNYLFRFYKALPVGISTILGSHLDVLGVRPSGFPAEISSVLSDDRICVQTREATMPSVHSKSYSYDQILKVSKVQNEISFYEIYFLHRYTDLMGGGK